MTDHPVVEALRKPWTVHGRRLRRIREAEALVRVLEAAREEADAVRDDALAFHTIPYHQPFGAERYKRRIHFANKELREAIAAYDKLNQQSLGEK